MGEEQGECGCTSVQRELLLEAPRAVLEEKFSDLGAGKGSFGKKKTSDCMDYTE